MSRSWNGKALLDRLLDELWSSSSDSAMKTRVINWVNEIQDDLISELPLDYFKIKLKKLLPTEQEFIDLGVQIPGASTATIATGGALTEDSKYKVYTTFVVYDDDSKKYIESVESPASNEVTVTATNKTINITAIPTFSGSAVNPQTIHRRVYLSKDDSEPFLVQDIEDNTTLTLSIVAEATSTVTPPSDSEIDQLSSDSMYFNSANWPLERQDSNTIRRYDPKSGSTGSSALFDYYGTQGIHLYPKLSAAATEDEKTLLYTSYRRPHEIFYDITRDIDLPIVFKNALVAGVIWKGYDFRDRSGAVTKANIYIELRKAVRKKLKRQRGRPGVVRDVNGDTSGYEV